MKMEKKILWARWAMASTLAIAVSACGGADDDTKTPAPAPAPAPGAAKPWVTGYYAGYFWDQYPPEKIDMASMTHVIFARLFPGGGQANGAPGEIVSGAHSAQAGIPQATGIAYKGSPSVEHYFVKLAHAAGTKALAVVGGNGDGPGFVASTANATVRAKFVKNLVDYLVGRDYDGLDIDWEDALDNATQQNQLIALLDELRAEANARARYQPPHQPLILTAPGYVINTNSSSEYPRAPAWRVEVAKRVDQYNLMSYGIAFANSWISSTWYFAPLRNNGSRGVHPTDVQSSFEAYAAAGVPKSKLGVGIGFYGVNYSAYAAWQPGKAYAANTYVMNGMKVYFANKAGTSAAGSGPSAVGTDIADGTVHWEYVADLGPDTLFQNSRGRSVTPGVRDSEYEYSYKNIYKWLTLGERHFDAATASTYMLFRNGLLIPGYPANGDHLGYLTYEDEESIAAKAKFVRDNGYGGAMIWTINYGVVDDATGKNPLLKATGDAFLK